jgi:NTE family protein
MQIHSRKVLKFRTHNSILRLLTGLFLAAILTGGCAHYPMNQPIQEFDPDFFKLDKVSNISDNSESLVIALAFSGGGTRASAFSYGVMEELAKTEVTIDGEKRRLLDEVDVISGVSGGSFTAAYYGLYGDRIFEDFEGRFLKKNVQGALLARTFFWPVNWVRLLSPYFGRSDLAAEYYDNYVFDGATFGDVLSQPGPAIYINATDMALGDWFTFTPDMFAGICSDLSSYPVSRAVAASSAVPVVLTPISLHNYAGSCGFEIPEWMARALEEGKTSTRQYHEASRLNTYFDTEKRPYIHLVDGGVVDNLGLRADIDRLHLMGDAWTSLKERGLENIHKGVIIVVNAEVAIDTSWERKKSPPGDMPMFSSFTNAAITRYNFETIMLLRSITERSAEEIRTKRCNALEYMSRAGAKETCDEIEFYIIEVKFDALPDEAERDYLKHLPTSFSLTSEQVDKLREAASRILVQSEEFQRLLEDIK